MHSRSTISRRCSPMPTSSSAARVPCGRWCRLADVHRGLAHGQEPKQLVVCDLGMPRNVDPAVAGLPGVFVVEVDRIQRDPSARAASSDTEAARTIVAAEVANYLAGQRMAEVTPTVTALRQRAADVVEAELLRLDNRLPPGGDAARRGGTNRAPCGRQAAARTDGARQAAGQHRQEATATPRRCVNSSNWTRKPSRRSPGSSCLWGPVTNFLLRQPISKNLSNTWQISSG